MSCSDTIFALASGAGRAGIAVLRLSGGRCGAVLDAMCGGRPQPRRATVFHVKHPETAEVLDQALVLWFPAPNSFTGEDCAEFHVHGGMAVIAAVTQAFMTLPHVRLAESGEFSRRAFMNGKLDLTQAEAIVDLVAAETPAQRRQALSQLGGDLADLYDEWRGQLLDAMAFVESCIDFPDEDIPANVLDHAHSRLKTLCEALRQHMVQSSVALAVRDGFQVAILGAPNAGKSSLINALAKRDVAIVTDQPGTTRDVLEVRLNINGFPVICADTAGLRDSTDEIEREGIRRAHQKAQDAHLRLWLVAPDQSVADMPIVTGDTVVLTKSDLSAQPVSFDGPMFTISTQTGVGVDALLRHISECVTHAMQAQELPPLTRLRHVHSVDAAITALERALTRLATSPELAGEDLRHAAIALSHIAGRVDVEDLLDKIFSEFCIGK